MHGPRRPPLTASDAQEIAPIDDDEASRLRTVLRFVVSACIVMLLGVVVYLWPASLGGRATIVFVTGSSMAPTLTSDDVVLAREHATYSVGDLVVFKVPEGDAAGKFIIHRIVGGSSSTGWVTRGDNRTTVDPWFLSDGDLVGRAERKAAVGPALRTTFRWVLAPLVWSMAAAIVAYVVMLRYLRERDASRERDSQSSSANSG